ncbi:MAG: hypothetical protein ABW063_09250 [Caulobacter sp.]
MAEDVHGLLSRINQPDLKYLTFADPEDGPETQPAAVETLKGGEAELQQPTAEAQSPRTGGLLRKYRAEPSAPPPIPTAVPQSKAVPLKPLFTHYAELMRQKGRRRA